MDSEHGANRAKAGPEGRVVIAGAGHAGGSAAAFLRQYGHTGPITLVGAESAPPYQRPPLSKAYLKGECSLESLLLRPDDFYLKHNIGLRLGERVTGIDRAAERIAIKGADPLPYDFLILAMGSENRRLPIVPDTMGGVHELRSLDDALGLRAALGPGRRVLIVGGGYVGLEAAASARALGAEAIVVEREARVLARTGSADLADFFAAYHRARGVEIITGAGIVSVEAGPDDAIAAVRLADGRRIAADVLLVGIGARPADVLAREAGLACEDGVVVDADARTSDPAIFAIGDMTMRPLPLYENRMFRLESVPNALEQARQAAAAIAGTAPPRPETPWFWSDQYDLKLQIAGLPFDADSTVLRGDPASGRFSVFHLQQGRVRAAEAVNAAADFMAAKAMILSGSLAAPERLADPAIPLKQACL
jgi:3-phenylpropionate/trans-cinnamate dioxygenase ferredoxin reductase subunit